MNIYKKIGYENRRDYLQSVAENYDIDINKVYLLADTLGSGEDFDGLIAMIKEFDF